MTKLELLGQGLVYTIFSMAIVFTLLICLQFIIRLQTWIIQKFSKDDKVTGGRDVVKKIENKPQVKESVDAKNNEEEIVAAIMAAIHAYSENSGKELRIKSIKRVNNTNIWRDSHINNNVL